MAQARVYQPDRHARAAEKRAEAARELLEYHLSGIRPWLYAHRKQDGHPFFVIQGTVVHHRDGGVSTPVHWTDLHDCTCDSHRKGLVACKHMLAVRLWHEAVKRGEVALPRNATRRDADLLEQASRIAEDLDIAEAADALLDRYEAEQRAAVRPAREWWLTDAGAPVWLAPEDGYAPDTDAPQLAPRRERQAPLRSYEDLLGDREHD